MHERVCLTCEVVDNPGSLSGQGWLAVQVGLKKRTQRDHKMNVTNPRAQVFHWAGGQEVSDAPQQGADELERTQ